MAIVCKRIWILTFMAASPMASALAQTSSPPFLTSVARISLIARLPSTVRLSQNLVRLSADLSSDQCAAATVPVDISWNIEPWVQEVQLLGGIPDSASALSDGHGHPLPATSIELQGDHSTWTPLPQPKAGTRSSGFTLATLAIVAGPRQGRQQIPLHFRICRPEGDFPPGIYFGQIQLHTKFR